MSASHNTRAAAPAPLARIAPIDLFDAFVRPLPPTVIDVRSLDEDFDARPGRVPGALLVPLEHVAAEAETLGAIGAPLVAYCHTDVRARRAGGALTAAGRGEVTVLDGIVAWRAAGLPAEHEAMP